MAERIPNAELKIIENVGHSVGFLEPEKMCRRRIAIH